MTILIPRCLKISEQINNIQTQINVSAVTTDILVEVQNKTQLLKEKESKEINALFKDIIVWLSKVVMENFRQEEFKKEEHLKIIYETAQEVQSLAKIINDSENKIQGEKDDLERQVNK
jgi:hypothetical protein